jgi:hypothetical protein
MAGHFGSKPSEGPAVERRALIYPGSHFFSILQTMV